MYVSRLIAHIYLVKRLGLICELLRQKASLLINQFCLHLSEKINDERQNISKKQAVTIPLDDLEFCVNCKKLELEKGVTKASFRAT